MINSCYILDLAKQNIFVDPIDRIIGTNMIKFKITEIDRIDLYHSVYYGDIIYGGMYFRNKTIPLNKWFFNSEIKKLDVDKFNEIWLLKEISLLKRYISDRLRISINDCVYRMEEFEVIKSDRVDMLSLESLFNFYSIKLIDNTPSKLYDVIFKKPSDLKISTMTLNEGILRF